MLFVYYIVSVLAPLCLLDFGGERRMTRSTLMMFVLSPGGMFSHLHITGNAREGGALGDLGASRKHMRPISALYRNWRGLSWFPSIQCFFRN
jgi:hypothetical protein